ncbi:hypothetical protein H0H81_012130 [Sphagnurus paluster]|uniref:Uncharacterized protein n=1 Tax=Sphagnurus paluster TaxID=117069 RepID=A0A9P7FRY6_9AGAR|nr:hypothetical protein H0H81_012130 [Sphagnurus paluster]
MRLPGLLIVTTLAYNVPSIVATSSASDLLIDIAGVSSALNTFYKNVAAFPSAGGSLSQAYAIHTGASNLATSINKATTDAKALPPGPLSYNDGLAVLKASQELQPVVAQSLGQTVAIQGALQSLLGVVNVQAYITQDLETTSASISDFGAVMVGIAPVSLVTIVPQALASSTPRLTEMIELGESVITCCAGNFIEDQYRPSARERQCFAKEFV